MMAAALCDQLHSEIAQVVYQKPPMLWEMFCSPDSELTNQALKAGLCAYRINLAGGFDLYRKNTYDGLRQLRRRHKPKKFWISTPCTFYCDWTDLNYHNRREVLFERRRKEKSMHLKVMDFAEEALLEDETADLYWEWPRRCRAWKEPHVEEFKTRLFKKCGRNLYLCQIDGCRYGMKDSHGNIIKKSWQILTTDVVFYTMFRLKVCLQNHEHAQIHGLETTRSAYYPTALCRSIAQLWRRTLVPDRWIKMLSTAPVVMDPFKELCDGDDHQAHLCSGLPDGDLFMEDDENVPDDAVVPAEVQPSEQDQRAWKAKLDRFHRQAGHPTARNMARMMADAQLPRWKIKMALEHVCPYCQEQKGGGISSKQINPASMRNLPGPWEQVGIDVSEWEVPGENIKVKFVIMMDLCTKYKVTDVLFKNKHGTIKNESAEEMIRSVSLRWLSDKPRPRILVPDNAKSLTAKKFVDYMSDLGIEVIYPPDHESWAHGLVERGHQLVKETASRIHASSPDQDPEISLALATAAVNSTEYNKGYSSIQWAFGRQAELTDDELRQHLQLPIDRQQDQFARLLTNRQSAEEHARKARADHVLSRIKNTTVKQPRRNFDLAQPVMVWRKFLPPKFHKGPRGGVKRTVKPRWIGPGRVVLHELIPGQVEGDPIPIVWAVIGKTLYRCSVFSVRPLSDREQAHEEATNAIDPNKWKQLSDIIPKREYVDIEHEQPAEGETEEFDLPEHPPDMRTAGTSSSRSSSRFPGVPYYVPDFSKVGPTGPMPPMRISGKKKPSDVYEQPEMVNDYGDEQVARSPSYAPTTPAKDPEPIDLEDDDFGNMPHGPLREDRRFSTTSSTPMVENKEPYLDSPEDGLPDPVPEPESKRARYEDEDDKEDMYMKHLQIFNQIDSGYLMDIELDLASNRQKKAFQRNPSLYLAKKLAGSEVSYRRLSANEKELFQRAMNSEVSSFIKTEAVRRCLSFEEQQEAKRSGRVLKSRWVLVWKSVPEESRAEALADAKENENTVHSSDGTRKAKARIVVLGYQHPDLLDPSLATTAPVQSQLVRNLSLCVVAQRRWQLEGLDMSTAFLQTGKTEEDRRIWMQGVPELNRALGAEPHEAVRILKNVYGNATALRGLWEDVDKTFCALGAKRLIGDSSFWIWTKPNPNPRNQFDTEQLIGFVGGHVDDFNRAGDLQDPEWLRIREAIDKSYKWGTVKINQYRHTGLDINVKTEGNDFLVEVDQNYYVEGLMDLTIAPERLKRTDNPQLTPDEVSACRAGLGAVQWAATQTQVQACARANLLLRRSQATMT